MKAVIDLGTNTFNLLIGDTKQKEKGILVSLEEPVMLGKGGIQDNRIMPEAFERAFNVLEKFKTVLNQYQIKSISAFATSAIRNALNGADFINQVYEKFQIQIESISGDLEAEYIYYGVRNSFDFLNHTYLIMDIGGGSVEFIIGNKEQYYWKQSFEVGAIRLHERFKKHDPILSSEILEIKTYLSEKLTPLLDQIKQYPLKGLIGLCLSTNSGSSLSEVDINFLPPLVPVIFNAASIIGLIPAFMPTTTPCSPNAVSVDQSGMYGLTSSLR